MGPGSIVIIEGKGVAIILHTFSFFNSSLESTADVQVIPKALTLLYVFYIHGSVHRNSMLIRSNKMQQYAGIYLLQNHSTCFGCPSHPSSGVHEIVTAASGTGHST